MNTDFTIATHALVYLDHMACIVSSEQLADNICTNPARVRKVMAHLVGAGLATSKAGANGGYAIGSDAASITLDKVADASGVSFVNASWRSGDIDRDCLVSSGMGPLMDGIYADLDNACRNHLSTISIADIGREIFGKEAISA